MTTVLARIAGAVMVFCGVSGVARADSPPSAPAANTPLVEVIVTAEKRKAPLEKSPLAVTVFTSADRDRLGVLDIQDYANFTPGLSYSNQDKISIRGSGRLTFLSGNDPGVAQYTDGFYEARSSELFKTPLFVDQLEVLRGPQGTLWGRNSIGGAITVTSPHPTPTLQGEIRAEGGNYNTGRLEGYISGPLNDAVRVRLGASRGQEDGGYLRNIGSGGNAGTKGETLYEAQVEADLTPHITAWIKYQRVDWADSYGTGDRLINQVTPYDTTDFFTSASQLVPNASYGYGVANPGVKNPYVINTNTPTRASLHGDDLVIAHLNWDVGFAEVKYIGGYQSYNYNTNSDLDMTGRTGSYLSPLSYTPIYPQYTLHFGEAGRYFTNEINVTSKGAGALQWIVGLYQYHENSTQQTQEAAPNQPELAQPYSFAFPAGLSPYLPNGLAAQPDAPNPGRAFYSFLGKLRSDSYAGFAQVDYRLTSHIKLTGGVRYTQDYKTGEETVRAVLFDPDMYFGVPGTPFVAGPIAYTSAPLVPSNDIAYDLVNGQGRYTGAWGGVTATAAVEWTPTDRDMLYARYGRGYKSGGFLLGTLASHPEAAPEYVDAYEIGYKGIINRQLRLNASLFYNNYTGLQVNLSQFNPAHQTTENDFLNLNARAYGVEFEGDWRPTRNLRFLIDYAYLNTVVTQGCNVATGAYCFADPQDPGATDPYAKPVAGVAPVSGQSSLPLPYSIYVAQTLKGDPLPQSPANKVAIDGAYTFHFTPGSLTVSAAYVWQDQQTSSVFSSSAYRYPAYAVTDFRLLWNDARKRYTAIAFVKNAFDVLGYSLATPSASINDMGVRTGYEITRGLIAPRTFGLELQYRF
jgi:iron complex outermembrane receptor protein